MIDEVSSFEPPNDNEKTREKLLARQRQFIQANASLALEGLRVTETDLAIQDKVARGDLTVDEAVEFFRARAGKESS